MTPLLEVLFNLVRSKGGDAPIADSADGDDRPAAQTPEERTAVLAEIDRLEIEAERKGVALAREKEQASEARVAAERGLEDARKREASVKAARDTYSWGVECRRSRLRAMLERGANPLINRVTAMLTEQWSEARLISRIVGSRFAPLSADDVAANQAADANLRGYQVAIAEIEDLKFAEDQSDRAIASAAEAIIGKIPSRHPQHQNAKAIELPKATNGGGRARLAHDGAKAVA